MTLFVVLAIGMVALGLAFLLWPLLRGRSRAAEVRQAQASLGILKDQLAELDADVARGTLAAEQYAESRAELERRVHEEVLLDPAARAAAPRSSAARWSALAVGVLVPVGAALFYARFGDPLALSAPTAQVAEGGHNVSPEQIAQMIAALEQRLQKEPDNAMGWSTLARTYYVEQRFADAVRAYARLVELVPNEAAVLADYADALAMTQGRSLAGKPMELVKKALTLDPTQWKALAMAGTDAFNRRDFALAVVYWERLQKSLPADAPIAGQIADSIAEARSLAGQPPPSALAGAPPKAPSQAPRVAAAPAQPPPSAAAKAPPAAAGGKVGGTVRLDAALKGKAAPTDRVYIFARAAQGSRMPLALTSVQVKDLPANFTLDDSMAMAPGMSLSNASDVVIGARVSKSGQVMPNSGDFEGLSTPVKVGAGSVAIVIDRVLP